MRYRIVATLGPASATPESWRGLMGAGASAFRLNTSHLTIDQLLGWLDRLEAFFVALGERVPVVLDLQGSKWRLGRFETFELFAGRSVRLVPVEETSESETIPVPHPDFFKAAQRSNGEIVLNDARSKLVIEDFLGDGIVARIAQGGWIEPRKGITCLDADFRAEGLGMGDREILSRTIGYSQVSYAISYVKDGAEMSAYRAWFPERAGLVAKLERGSALADALEIARFADELWLCRGDLGAELGLRQMAEAAHVFTGQIRDIFVPTLLAGQVLEHMTGHPAPTRAEVSALYDALLAGYAGVVLSDETAIGANPLEACRTAGLFLK